MSENFPIGNDLMPFHQYQEGDEITPGHVLSKQEAEKLNAAIVIWWEREDTKRQLAKFHEAAKRVKSLSMGGE